MKTNRLIFIAAVLFATPFCLTAGADTIFLNDGRIIKTIRAWEEGDKINCYMHGSIVGFPKDSVTKIEYADTSVDTAKQESGHKAGANESMPASKIQNFLNATKNQSWFEPKTILFKRYGTVLFNDGSEECCDRVIWFTALFDDMLFCRKSGEVLPYPINEIDMTATVNAPRNKRCLKGTGYFVQAMEGNGTVSFLDSMEGMTESKLMTENLTKERPPEQTWRYIVSGEVRYSREKPVFDEQEGPAEIWKYHKTKGSQIPPEHHYKVSDKLRRAFAKKSHAYLRMLWNPETKEYERPSFKATRTRLREIRTKIKEISPQRREYMKTLKEIEARIRNAGDKLAQILRMKKAYGKLKAHDIKEQSKTLENLEILKSSYEKEMNNPINETFEKYVNEAEGYCTGRSDLKCPFGNCAVE